MEDLIKKYLVSLNNANEQLKKSNTDIMNFRNVITQLISFIKTTIEQVKRKFLENTKNIIDYVKQIEVLETEISTLQQVPPTDSNYTNARHAINQKNSLLETYKKYQGFEIKYFAKQDSLEKITKRAIKTIDSIMQNFDIDRNNAHIIQGEIQNSIYNIKMGLSKITASNLPHSALNKIILKTHQKVDILNNKINNYNRCVDNFNIMSTSLQVYILTYSNPKKVLSINLTEFVDQITEIGEYSFENVDIIKRTMDEYFRKYIADTTISLIQINAPDLSFINNFKEEPVVVEPMEFENIPSTPASDDTTTPLPDNINDTSAIPLTIADWNSDRITPTLLARYCELCAAQTHRKIRYNHTATDTNFDINISVSEDWKDVFMLYKIDYNTLAIFYRKTQALPQYFETIKMEYTRFYEYAYTDFTLNECCLIIYLITINNNKFEYFKMEDLVTNVKLSIRDHQFLSLAIYNTTPRQDIEVETPPERPNKRIKINLRK